ncbi:tRNA pseudouridine(55) synthase TruB, partial [Brachyspira pilosicoli]|nr:tRNA pseudouridine(55) synthase TruB [Brachyspira pilosicoli]
MKGFLIVNKPKGITSFDVIRKLKPILKEKRIGHVGTLDPFASGVLIIALGRYTKLFF